MFLYALLTIFMGFAVYFKWRQKSFGLLLLVVLFVLSAFRGEKIGNDTKTYTDLHYLAIRGYNYTSFTNIQELSLSDFGGSSEIISNTLYRIIIDNNINTRYVIVFYSFITFLFLYYSSKRYRVPLSYILAFFSIFSFFPYSCNIARQICSATILLVAYSFLEEKSRKRFYFFFYVILASAIHSFSLIFIILYLIRKIGSFKPSVSLLLMIILVIFSFIGCNMISIIPGINEINHIASYLSSYEGDDVNIMSIISSSLTAAFYFYFYYRALKSYSFNTVLLNIVFLSVIVMMLLSPLSGTIRRLSYDLTIINCAFLSLFFTSKKVMIKNIDRYIFIMMCIFYTYTNFRIIEYNAPQYYFSF